jgi:uncharacterized protein YbaR (Trm112 family)
MHILLTDILTCPRCGPEFGLVLLADRVEDRRVLEGRLGCPNCREQYPVSGGVIDARLSAERTSAAASPSTVADELRPAHAADEAEAAVRLAALLGLADARGTVLVAGPGAALAPTMAALVPEVEVVAVTASPDASPERVGVTRIAAGAALPFRSRTLRGAALTGGADAAALGEALRLLQPGARLVVQDAAAGTAEHIAGLGAQVILDQEGTVVARAVGDPVQLRLNALR